MTKRELIYLVFERLNIDTDDSDQTAELISALVDTKRAMLLKQQFSVAHWNMSITSKQEICLNLENVAQIDGMTCFGKILRTKLVLPKSIRVKGKDGPLTVRRADRTSVQLIVVPFERLPFVGYNQFVAQMIYCAEDYDGRLYLVSNQKKHHLMESIKVGDVFENPEEANELDCEKDESIDYWDQEYPLEAAMIDTVVDLIVKDLALTLSIPGDETNDSDGKKERQ